MPINRFRSYVIPKEIIIVCKGAKSVVYMLDKSAISPYKVDFILDADILHDDFIDVYGRKVLVRPIENVDRIVDEEKIILILADYNTGKELYEILENNCFLRNIACYWDWMMEYEYNSEEKIRDNSLPDDLRLTDRAIIPRIIHYCWFGKSKMPKQLEIYVDGWKRLCPDYKIIRWDERNYDIEINQYVRSAYAQKAWAFVSDYARKDIIYRHGGIYLDTDVELVRNIDDLLYQKAFFGTQRNYLVNSGLGFGAVKEFGIIKELRDIYENEIFELKPRNQMVIAPDYETNYFMQHGYQKNRKYQVVDGVTIYPPEILSATDVGNGKEKLSENTYALHHHAGTWNSDKHILREKQLFFSMARKNSGIEKSDGLKNVTKISVIVPVFNAEKYVKECLESILTQDFCDYEVICIDDGSTDNSLEIVSRFEEKYKNVRVIKTINGGVSAARNRGIDEAKGKYIYFIDSDDKFDGNNALKFIVETMEALRLDVLCFDADCFFENDELKKARGFERNYFKKRKLHGFFYHGYDLLKDFVDNKDDVVSVPLAAYRRDFLKDNDLKFIYGILHEDNAFTFSVLLLANNVAHINKSVFLRRVREGSITTKKFSYENFYGVYRALAYMENFRNRLCVPADVEVAIDNWLSRLKRAFNMYYDKLSIMERSRIQKLSLADKNIINQFLGTKFQVENNSTHSPIEEKYLYPYHMFMPNSRVLLCGNTDVAVTFYKQVMETGYSNIIAILDDVGSNKKMNGMDIVPIDSVNRYLFDFILITDLEQTSARKIKNKLVQMGIKEDCIKWCGEQYSFTGFYQNYHSLLSCISNKM